jgi:diguanylate cyclase (GGDEF)-like protein
LGCIVLSQPDLTLAVDDPVRTSRQPQLEQLVPRPEPPAGELAIDDSAGAELVSLRQQLASVEQRRAALENELSAARLAQQQLQSYADDFHRTYAESRRRLQRMTMLYEVSSAITAPVDPAVVLSRTIEGVSRLLPSTSAALYLLDETGQSAQCRSASRAFGACRIPERLPRQEGLLARALDAGQSVLERWQPGGKQRPGWALALPLIVAGQTLGALLLVKRGAEPIASEERHLAEMVAAQTAMALQHARLATTDALTGLYNRRHFELSLVAECARARRSGRPLGLLMIDVDRFKRFNQRYGHPAGDAVLRQVASTLVKGVRGTDILARLGGEEFAAVLPEADLAAVEAVAERLRQAVAIGRPIEFEGRQLPSVRISLGGVSRSDNRVSAVELVRLADGALRRAKRSGRNRALILGREPEPDQA